MTLHLVLLVGLGMALHLMLLVTLYLSTVVNLTIIGRRRDLCSIPLPYPVVNLKTWKNTQT